MKKTFKKTSLFFTLCLFICNCSSQINLNKISDKVKDQIDKTKTENTSNPLTNDEVIKGLKEALSRGIEKGANQASSIDGFLKKRKMSIYHNSIMPFSKTLLPLMFLTMKPTSTHIVIRLIAI